eukprot:TRINITY_DN36083_c0_g1_i1.p2 TRINITY_DN36083_c0_g1~~TRINITY_DN36083_c0_g1_i1.p2  ORF type:complete len:538 (+),score=118.63 TRINITY_DN36083_c0_g1_i1:92-1615(+)
MGLPAVGAEVEAHGLVNLRELNGAVGIVRAHGRTEDGAPAAVVDFEAPHGRMKLRQQNLRPAAAPSAHGHPVGSRVRAHGLSHTTDLNGACGVVTGHRTAPDGTRQCVVRFGPPHGVFVLRECYLETTAPSDRGSAAGGQEIRSDPVPVAAPAAAPEAPAPAAEAPAGPVALQPPRPAAAAPAPAGCPAEGRVVELSGFSQLPHLNGLRGPVLGYRDRAPGVRQMIVRLPAPHGAMAVRPQNATAVPEEELCPVGSAVRAQGLVQRRDVNGELGEVIGFRDEPGGRRSVVVSFRAEIGALALLAANVELVHGPPPGQPTQGGLPVDAATQTDSAPAAAPRTAVVQTDNHSGSLPPAEVPAAAASADDGGAEEGVAAALSAVMVRMRGLRALAEAAADEAAAPPAGAPMLPGAAAGAGGSCAEPSLPAAEQRLQQEPAGGPPPSPAVPPPPERSPPTPRSAASGPGERPAAQGAEAASAEGSPHAARSVGGPSRSEGEGSPTLPEEES